MNKNAFELIDKLEKYNGLELDEYTALAESFDKETEEETKTTKTMINEQIENKGGVNLALALTAGFVFLAIVYMPLFI